MKIYEIEYPKFEYNENRDCNDLKARISHDWYLLQEKGKEMITLIIRPELAKELNIEEGEQLMISKSDPFLSSFDNLFSSSSYITSYSTSNTSVSPNNWSISTTSGNSILYSVGGVNSTSSSITTFGNFTHSGSSITFSINILTVVFENLPRLDYVLC